MAERRTTRQDIYDSVNRLNELGYDVKLNFQMGGGRVTTNAELDLSPRLRVSDLNLWLEGFRKGIDQANLVREKTKMSEDQITKILKAAEQSLKDGWRFVGISWGNPPTNQPTMNLKTPKGALKTIKFVVIEGGIRFTEAPMKDKEILVNEPKQ